MPIDRMPRRFLMALLLLGPISACGGGGGGGSPTGPEPTASITVAAEPTVWVAGPCPPEHCGALLGELEVTGSLRVTETSGVAGTLQTVSIDVRDAADASIATPTYEPSAHGGDRLPAFGSVTLTAIGVHFSSDRPAATLRVTVPMRDDHGHSVSAATTIEVH